MSIELDPAREKALKDAARKEGRDPSEVLSELIDDFLTAKNGPESGDSNDSDPAYEPSHTELGRTLRALSRKYVETGGKLYSVDEINREVAEGRGER
ncbi:MAG TPA: hypothetical protein VMT52_04285 [Planctomycetota bacterium]|nr:hypothetical protein [Planctomycetota bacterium]